MLFSIVSMSIKRGSTVTLLLLSFCYLQGTFAKTDPQSVTNTLEQVITFYCKSRNIPYKEDNGMTELLGPLATLEFTKGDLFNCLYVLLSKYIPR